MKMLVQRWLFIFAAFVMAAAVVLSGCTDAVVGHDTASANSNVYRSQVTVHNSPVAPALMESSEALDASRLLQAREETQRARRLISRW